MTTGYLAGNEFESMPDWSRDNYAAFAWGVRGGKYVGEVTPELMARVGEEFPLEPA